MNRAIHLLAVAAVVALAGCVAVPAGTAYSACRLLEIASSEADLAPAWYAEAGTVLEGCGVQDARANGDRRACFAESRQGYRSEKDCEALK